LLFAQRCECIAFHVGERFTAEDRGVARVSRHFLSSISKMTRAERSEQFRFFLCTRAAEPVHCFDVASAGCLNSSAFADVTAVCAPDEKHLWREWIDESLVFFAVAQPQLFAFWSDAH